MARALASAGGVITGWWARLAPLPFGRTLFSIAVGRMAPYTGSIGARIEELRPGYARWGLRDRRRVRNHLDSVHAVALVNFAEVCSGTAMMASLPPGVRGIVTGLSIEYHKKARGRLTAETSVTVPPITEDTRLRVPAVITNADGETVATAHVEWLLSPPRSASER